MKNILTFIVFILLSQSVISQDNQKIQYKIVYKIDVLYKDKKIIDDSCALDISSGYSFFYSLGEKTASLYVKKEIEQQILAGSQKLDFSMIKTCSSCYKNTYKKDYTNNNIYRIASIMTKKYAYPIDSLVRINWELQNVPENINGIECFKATGKLDSTIYYVWYAPSIPVSDGPVFLKGLPGLIIKCLTNNGIKITTV